MTTTCENQVTNHQKTSHSIELDALFRLELSDRNGWTVCASKAAYTWTHRFSQILELPNCKNNYRAPYLVFLKNDKQCHVDLNFAELAFPDNEIREQSDWEHYDYYGMRIYHNTETLDIIYDIGYESNTTENIYNMWAAVHPIYRHAVKSNGIPLHAALAERNGIGILFAAPGGTGKTTTLNRLPGTWNKICDDETLVIPGIEDQYRIHPFPTWSSFLQKKPLMSWQVNSNFKLGAIFFLKHGEHDFVEHLRPVNAAALINQSARQIMKRGWSLSGTAVEKTLKHQVFSNAVELAKKIPTYMLIISKNGNFWEKVEDKLNDRGRL
ncbi:MAG: SynChlorMet cassette protein ScmC [Candidatus Electryonea clarkiae]|nr:SynChlorMet cassette protein ScmC [Candidatus Electryonea clarkiae]MDP8286989.1 SynChlorMet cassette protein ScmC [Candidatus Electryonea clarkiae]